MSGFTGTMRLVRLALRRDRITLPAWILGMAAFLAATTAMFADSYAKHPAAPGARHPGRHREPGDAGPGPRDGSDRRRLHPAPGRAHPGGARRPHECLRRRPPYPSGRGARSCGDAGRRRRRSLRLAGRGCHRRARRERRTGRAARARHDRRRTARHRFAGGRRVDRAGGRGVHRRRRCDLAAGVDHARGDRSRRCCAGGLVPARGTGQHARHGRLRRAAGDQRVAGLALADRLGPADAAVRGQPVVARRVSPCSPSVCCPGRRSFSSAGATSAGACGPSAGVPPMRGRAC